MKVLLTLLFAYGRHFGPGAPSRINRLWRRMLAERAIEKVKTRRRVELLVSSELTL